MTNREVEDLLGTLPPRHITNPPLRTILYISETSLRYSTDRRRSPQQILGECIIGDGEANIRLFQQQTTGNHSLYDFKFSILHEIGHVVFWHLKDRQQQKWYSLYGQTPIIWNEAGRNPDEHFCDTYAHYLMNPLLVKKRFVKEYQFMKIEVFH
jgi:hypothetical protein